MRRLMVLGLVAVSLLAGGLAALAQKPEPEQPMSVWMKRKLEASQSVLEGLALEDYEKIRGSAESMHNLSLLEGFVRRTEAEDYRTQLRVFRYASKQLMRAADKKDLDGAALAFNQLTLSCVNCHKLLRSGEK